MLLGACLTGGGGGGGGGGLKLFGQCPNITNTFQKGASLILIFCTKSAKASKLELQNPGKNAMYRAGVVSKRGKEVANKKNLIRCLTFN